MPPSDALNRRNTLTKQNLLVKIASGYCVVTYLLVIFMFIFYWCHPTYEYWAVPVRIGETSRAARSREPDY